MKHLSLLLILSLTLISSGCSEKEAANHQEHLLQSALWYQQSAEMEALYYQSFNWAEKVLAEKIQSSGDVAMAVVLDIDETILDNSPQTAHQVLENKAYNDKIWDEWCTLVQAAPLPGALEFTKSAIEMGVEVFYISNRKIHLLEVTLENMKKIGFPNADPVHVLLRTGSSAKDERREKVKETHEIALLIGDNLGDFAGIFDQRQEDGASGAVYKNRHQFGERFIMLPNPMYGGWEKAFRGGTPEQTIENKLEGLIPYTKDKQ